MFNSTAILNAHLLTDIFGEWPSFHDAEVLSLNIDRGERQKLGPTLQAEIYVFKMTSEIDEKGYYTLRDKTVVTLLFRDIVEMELADFNHQNVLFGLKISDIRERQLEYQSFDVQFDSSYGLAGKLQCREIEVLGVRPF